MSQGVNGLVHFVAIVLFLVWIHRLTTAIRATQGSSAYSPGMAVGGWFIPLANFVLPYLTVRDAWKRTMPGDGRGAVVALWWASYLAAMVFSIIYGLPGLTQSLYHALGNGGLVALSWVYFLATVATWGSMLLFVRWITERTAGRPA